MRLGPGSRSAPALFQLKIELKQVVMMIKKLLPWLLAAIGLVALSYGCRNMAVEMSGGEMLYRAKCSSCHNIIEPSRHGKETWEIYVDEYGKKMTIEEKRAVLQYLVGFD